MDPEASSGSWLIIKPINTRWNRFSVYWPKLKNVGIPTPTTKLIPLGNDENGTVVWDTNQIISTMNAWDTHKAFIRSDYKAAPKQLMRGSLIDGPIEDEVDRTVRSLITQLSAAGWEHGDVLILREWLDLGFCKNHSHTNCHPEVRFFIEDGEVLGGTHIETGVENVCDLQYEFLTDVLEAANSEIPRKYARNVARHFTQHTWAVDFVMGTNGDWYCTEMGLNAVRWAQKENNWINHCDHSDLEPFGPCEIHAAALRRGKAPVDN